MKKIIFLSLLVLLGISACQNSKKTETKQENKTETKKWVLNQDNSSIHWTAYKTTAKVPVKGEFKKFEISGIKPSDNLPETLKNAQVKINIFSVFSGVEARDKKIIEYLFQHMMETNQITVKVLNVDSAKNLVKTSIKMNNHEKEIPLKMNIDKKNGQIKLTGTIDLVKDFDAAEPLYFLNTACFDLHKGKDGISKTWPDVSISAVLNYEKK